MKENNASTKKRSKLRLQYSDFLKIIGRYWRSYGRWSELVTSPFVHVAIVLTALSAHYWLSTPWHATATAILPNLLGFGVSGFAIWIGWGDARLRDVLTKIKVREDVSAFEEISSIFAHFGLVQVTALLFALLASALDYEPSVDSMVAYCLTLASLPINAFSYLKPVGFAIGYFLFTYAILTTLETTLALFRLATWVQVIAPGPSNKSDGSKAANSSRTD